MGLDKYQKEVIRDAAPSFSFRCTKDPDDYISGEVCLNCPNRDSCENPVYPGSYREVKCTSELLGELITKVKSIQGSLIPLGERTRFYEPMYQDDGKAELIFMIFNITKGKLLPKIVSDLEWKVLNAIGGED